LRHLVGLQKDFVENLEKGKVQLKVIETCPGLDEISQLNNLFSRINKVLSFTVKDMNTTGGRLEDMLDENLRHFQELSQSTNEMGISARKIADTSTDISRSATETADQSTSGRKRLKKMVIDLSASSERIQEGVSRMDTLEKKVQEVDQVIQIIRNIASQTNLLALNAAIEASRAGDAGKGFAVVAEEVRKLALQTSKSAENVIELVQGIQEETREAVKLIQQIQEQSTKATEGARASQEIFENISNNGSIFAQQTQEIAAATNQQNATVESMGRRIQELFRNIDEELKPSVKEILKLIQRFEIKDLS